MKLTKIWGKWDWVDRNGMVYDLIADVITDKQAYEWVKSGYWSFKEFSRWKNESA
jgi:hypothetical protein